jgi:hypothetical protein
VQKVHRQLSEARSRKGLSLDGLRRMAGLKCSVASMSRKLSGKRPLTDREIGRLARALDIEVVVERVKLGASPSEQAA